MSKAKFFFTYRNFNLVMLFIVFLVCFLIPIKSIFINFLLIFTFFNFRKFLKKRYLVSSLVCCLLLVLFGVPDILVSLHAFYFTEHYLSSSQFRALDTVIIRQIIFESNIDALFSGLSSFLFGHGYNAAAGINYDSLGSWYNTEIGGAYESGLLFFLCNFGVLGCLGFGLFIYRILSNTHFGPFKTIFLALLFSNLFQDNVGSLFWLFMGLAWGESVAYRTRINRLGSLSGEGVINSV
ncbi:hypothetical protein [Alteromonas gracilis]|uniref:hypothetical protein n=1 Tax=Alteromonas gracilis TaxID=1479524 RepID=UPI002FE3FF81